MDCINYGARKKINSMGTLFSINRERKADNQRIEFDLSMVPERTIPAGEAADIG